jgi:hypothetical protein
MTGLYVSKGYKKGVQSAVLDTRKLGCLNETVSIRKLSFEVGCTNAGKLESAPRPAIVKVVDAESGTAMTWKNGVARCRGVERKPTVQDLGTSP